jgi:cell fate regulator YaaT (PSP1 superfamily)
MAETKPHIVGVRFSKVGKVYHFDASSIADITKGDQVVVETTRGWQLGEVTQIIDESILPPDGGWKHVERRATPRDLLQKQNWLQKEIEVLEYCRQELPNYKYPSVKLVSVEISFDGNRMTVFYAYENEDKIDFKVFRQAIQKKFNLPLIEFRQIGPRDVAKCIGGMGACGLEMRCCSKFLTDFNSISIRMAKEQGISLTPSEITGMCGRLRCCLIYEYENYVQMRKQLPKRNAIVKTPVGEGKVLEVYTLRQAVLVDIPESGAREFKREEIQFQGSTLPQQNDENQQVDDSEESTEDDHLKDNNHAKK